MDPILKVETKHAKIYKDRKAAMTKIIDAAKPTVDDAVEVVDSHALSSPPPSTTTLCRIIFTKIKTKSLTNVAQSCFNEYELHIKLLE